MVTDVDDYDAVVVIWRVNNISSSSASFQTYADSTGITAVGTNTPSTTLTIPGYPTLNETTVKCIATGDVNNQNYLNTTTAKLYIQGYILTHLYNNKCLMFMHV